MGGGGGDVIVDDAALVRDEKNTSCGGAKLAHGSMRHQAAAVTTRNILKVIRCILSKEWQMQGWVFEYIWSK